MFLFGVVHRELALVQVDGEAALTGGGDALAQKIELGVVIDDHCSGGQRDAIFIAATVDGDPVASQLVFGQLGFDRGECV
jgi:hypothetical protein